MGTLEIYNKHLSVGTEGGQELAWNLITLTDTTGVCEVDPFCQTHFGILAGGNQFLGNAGFYLINRNPPTVQVELTAGY